MVFSCELESSSEWRISEYILFPIRLWIFNHFITMYLYIYNVSRQQHVLLIPLNAWKAYIFLFVFLYLCFIAVKIEYCVFNFGVYCFHALNKIITWLPFYVVSCCSRHLVSNISMRPKNFTLTYRTCDTLQTNPASDKVLIQYSLAEQLFV